MNCERCSDERWVCEDHDTIGWPCAQERAQCCGGAGMPCPDCNPVVDGLMPLDENGERIVPNLLMSGLVR